MTYHYASSRMAKIKITENTNVGEGMEQPRHSKIFVGTVMWYNHLGKQFRISSKLVHSPPLYPNNSTSRYLAERNENLCQ